MASPRFVPPSRDQLSADQRPVYELITGGRRASGSQLFALTDADGRLNGPFGAMLLAPPLGAALQQVGVAIRYESTLPDRVREMAILLTAARWDCEFERYAHEPIAAAVGVTADEIAAIRGLEIPRVDEAEAVALRITRGLLVDGTVDDELYEHGAAVLGLRAMYELTVLVGYYSTLALQLRVFRIGAPDGAE